MGVNDIRVEKKVNNNPQYTIAGHFTMWVYPSRNWI